MFMESVKFEFDELLSLYLGIYINIRWISSGLKFNSTDCILHSPSFSFRLAGTGAQYFPSFSFI